MLSLFLAIQYLQSHEKVNLYIIWSVLFSFLSLSFIYRFILYLFLFINFYFFLFIILWRFNGNCIWKWMCNTTEFTGFLEWFHYFNFNTHNTLFKEYMSDCNIKEIDSRLTSTNHKSLFKFHSFCSLLS